MAITVKDILSLKSAAGFIPIAGQNGLNSSVEMVDMLDFAWENKGTYSEDLFDRYSFVVSSLLFARDDEKKLYETLRRLIECGVSGLAYKTVFFQSLPREVCALADENNFPIFRFDDNITFREIIVDIEDAVRLNKDILKNANYLSEMISKNLSQDEITRYTIGISSMFNKYARVTMLSEIDLNSTGSVDNIIRRFRSADADYGRVALCKFMNGLAIIATMPDNNPLRFDFCVRRIFSSYVCPTDATLISHSDIHLTGAGLATCVKESYYASIAAQVLEHGEISYNQIGTLQFLIPIINTPSLHEFMKRFLNPIFHDGEMMKTAIAFVRSDANYDSTAAKLNCHKNTIRYRVNKIHLLLAPDAAFETFYEALSISIKTLLIRQIHSIIF
ncbi:MAG: Purine catabolism regulatory protein-like family protein [Firmicutes bacterium ADurb.Bin248]|nr:MAG: Purine catabolism regulatory protein-like family protein [Firmicutes bacterium ADurb.Bin248]